MRDLLMLGIVLGALPFAIRHTWIGVLLWTWISIMNPHRLAFGFAHDAPWAAIVAATVFLSLLITRDALKVQWEPALKALLLFLIWVCITTIFAFYPALSSDQLVKVLKIQVMTFVAFAALTQRKHIEWFIWVNALSIGFYGFKGGLFTLRSGGGGHVQGPPGGFIEGNNEIGLALIMVIPLMNYLRLVAPKKWVRSGLMVLMLLSATAALGTQSRGAFLAISAMGLVLWLRSSSKANSAVVIAVVAMALAAFMPTSWEERMRTIGNYQDDSSAMGRINAWWMALNLANDRFLGGGFEVSMPELFARYAPVPDDLHAAHSIYFQVLGEHGYVGLILFLSIWFFAFRTAGALRKATRADGETQWLFHLAGMCQVSLVGYGVGGAFLSLSYFDLPYNILVVLVVSWRWLQAQPKQANPRAIEQGLGERGKLRPALPRGAPR